MSITQRIGGLLLTRTSRRSFLAKSAMTATALSVAPVDYLLRPGTAYAQICQCVPGQACDCSSTCCNGYTQFCCTINDGVNACPAGTFAGGWWKADGSIYCAGPRYYIDCMGECQGCGCGGGNFCPSCDGLNCECALGSCDNYHVGCVEFRYGQCNQQIGCSGRISCRMVSCTPPWLIDPTCSTVAQTDDNTADQNVPCLEEETVTPQDIANITAAVQLMLRQEFVPGSELFDRVIQATMGAINEEMTNISNRVTSAVQLMLREEFVPGAEVFDRVVEATTEAIKAAG